VAATKKGIIAADPDALARHVPDLANWPRSWCIDDPDLVFGQALLEVFVPFLQHLLAQGYARKTFNRHRDHLWMLGGALIEHRYLHSEKLGMDARALILDQTDELGGPLLSKRLSESEHNPFDATCRKLHYFLSATSGQ